MIKESVAGSPQETTTESQPAYVLRGLGLFELHRDEILAGYQGGGRWLVPSGSESGSPAGCTRPVSAFVQSVTGANAGDLLRTTIAHT